MRAQGLFASGHTAGSMSTRAVATLGIIAGSGRLPLQLIEACQSTGRDFFVLALQNYADLNALKNVPHAVVRLGAVGEAISHLRRAGATELVLAGRVQRPSFGSLRPDLLGTKLLARMGAAFLSGDDAVLRSVITFLEEEGFKVVGSNHVLHELVTPLGQLGKMAADERAQSDIALGLKVALTLGELDIGQAVIVENGYVLGVEAAEGTDALIGRCGPLKRDAKGGVLIKVCKPGQEERVDLPTIGPDTIEKVAQCGFSGIAVQASASIILDRQTVISKADALGLFIVGVRYE